MPQSKNLLAWNTHSIPCPISGCVQTGLIKCGNSLGWMVITLISIVHVRVVIQYHELCELEAGFQGCQMCPILQGLVTVMLLREQSWLEFLNFCFLPCEQNAGGGGDGLLLDTDSFVAVIVTRRELSFLTVLNLDQNDVVLWHTHTHTDTQVLEQDHFLYFCWMVKSFGFHLNVTEESTFGIKPLTFQVSKSIGTDMMKFTESE